MYIDQRTGEDMLSAQRHLADLRARAAQCRRLAAGIGDRHTVATLTEMAGEYEEQARQLEHHH
jgi:DNA-binding transcriptional regulator LsrR (DeoR family)